MLNIKELFLLLALTNQNYSNKVLIKNLYSSYEDFLGLFIKDLDKPDLIISPEEKSKIKDLRSEIKKINSDAIKKILYKEEIQFIPLCEKEYPEKLRELTDPPIVLFCKGNLSLLKNSKSVAIVGTRSATGYGLNIAKEVASLLAKQNVVVISGLASGIDSSAHIGAIENGKTIAVFGTGVDVIFPAENKDLYFRILEKNGLIISEYPPKIQGSPWNFPQRNRIISALSDAVIIVEGDIQSGAMITARFAIKQGKPLFALPGRVDSPASNGPNLLIKSGVSELLTSASEVLEKIGLPVQGKLNLEEDKTKLINLSSHERKIYDLISGFNSSSFDFLYGKSNVDMQDLIKTLSLLELRGYIEKTMDGRYIKV